MPDDDLSELLKEVAYTAVGLGVLGVQRLQVGRRQLARQVEPQVREAATRLQKAAAAADEAVNPVLDRFEARLPEAAREVVHSARTAATSARDTALARTAAERRPGEPRATSTT